ncbi:O-antigen ligase [uncultured Psychrobacter sp.]|uniref:O-antigen ligase family protein n=1 Tax=uncultured Psychrobacter sp. TaxID=259303 RepID=UPI0026325D53|nr:O-antigen ligase family protein [uncultured Psychrobacter sp.]
MKIKNYYIELLLVISVFGSVIQYGVYKSSILFPATFLLTSLLLFLRVNYFKINKKMIAFLGFITVIFIYSIIASLLQQSYVPIATLGFFCLAAFLFTLQGFNRVFDLHVFYKLFLFASLVFCILSFMTGFSIYQFRGIYENPNQLGIFSSALFGVYLLIVLDNNSKEKIRYKFFLLTSCFILLIFLLASNSRTSLISMVAPLLALGFIYLYKSTRFNKSSLIISKKSVRNFTIFTLALASLFFLLYYLGYIDPVINKFEVTSSKGDITSDRSRRWYVALDYINPVDSSQQQYSSTKAGGVHNNYLQLALNFGWVGTFLFYIPFLYMLCKSAIEVFRKNNLASKLCFYLTIYFMILSLAEVGSAIFVIWLCFISFGYLLSGRD